MKTVILFIIILLNLIRGNLGAQVPEIIWEHGFGGNGDDRSMDIIQTPDSGFLAVGYSHSSDGDITSSYGEIDYWVVKMTSNGEILWENSYGGSAVDYCTSACNAFGGGYILAGHTFSKDGEITDTLGGADIWIVKIDEVGEVEWQKSLGGNYFDDVESIIQTSDNCYVMAGHSSSNDGYVNGNHGSSTDYLVVKINIDGDVIFANCYGSFETDNANDIIQTSDGNYMITGYSSEGSGDVTGSYGALDLWLIKIGSTGNLIWEKTFGGSETDVGETILEMDNGNILCAGYTYSNDGVVTGFHGGIDSWILCLDSLGNLLWQHSYGGVNFEVAMDIVQYSPNKYVFAGGSQTASDDVTTNYGLTDYWVVCIDSLGEIIWQKSLGGSAEDLAYACTKTFDSCIVVTGYSNSDDFDVTGTYASLNYWVVKLRICSNSYYADIDGDGYGDIFNDSIACEQPLGFTIDSTDCNDADNLIHPFVSDLCNSIDDNCNGSIDEDAVFITWYLDFDNDGFGYFDIDSITCFEISGYVFDSTDCNDENSEINPGMTELCNQTDDNCNELIDEDLVYEMYFIDEDGDNFGNVEIDSLWCTSIINYVIDSTDCDDTNPNIYPGASEILNGLDDDCDGFTDENLAINNTLLNAIKIYPNPAETILHIEYAGNSTCRIEILSVTGEVIYRNELSSSTKIDISKFANGIYFLKIMWVDGEAGVKVVKE